MKRPTLAALLLAASALAAPMPALAQKAEPTFTFAIEAQPLDRALTEVGRATGREIIVDSGAAAGKRAPRLVGRLSADEAIRRLLAGSGLSAEFRDDVILVRGAASSRETSGLEDIVVTGTRIRGSTSPSPTRVISAKQIRDAGQSDLGEVARTLPQSFGGGQNPEIGIGVSGANANQNAASNLNLRGLGADATLTLLNGHRLAHDGTAQAIDISSIPLAAVDRIEIVPDGASALYGSDAVGGVANVILKRDFRGLNASARVDIATEGGGTRQLYTATAGTVWADGGGLISIDIDHMTPITAGDRAITRALAPSSTLVREQSHQGAIASLHQDVGEGVSISIDAVYSKRTSYGETPYTPAGTVRDFGNTSESDTRSIAVAPTISIDITPDWQLTLQGLYGNDRLRYETVGFSDGAETARFAGCICNILTSVEGTAEGALFTLPGGTARVAIGAGVRRAALHYTQVGSLDFERARTTRFAYGELALPLVGKGNAAPGAREFLLSLAGRYERYPGTGGVFSPKFGMVYAPVAGVDLKATWGRSFKAPTLYQQYSPGYLTVLNAVDLGYAGYPVDATIGILNGGSATLQPERARTWSATLDVHPERWGGARLAISYFDVDFTNRVQVPVQSLFNALGNPNYAAFILYAPSQSDVASALAMASAGLDNETGRTFDPAQLVAIIDGGYRNVTSERAAGIDVSASYRADMSDGQALNISADASYLTSRRTLIPALPPVALAGTVFNPPRLRARAGAVWTTQVMTLSAFGSYVGGVEDRRTATTIDVPGQTTLDLSGRVRLSRTGWLRGTELAFTVRNVFDTLPAPIATSFAYATPYDTTNYSAIGRVVGLQVSQRW